MKTTLLALLVALSSSMGLAAGQSCANNYGCLYGEQCVKGMYQSMGMCFQTVNQYGTREFKPQNVNNNSGVETGTSMCSWDTQCGLGFRCLKRLGEYKGHCFKR
jgi:hypothetical protein